ncbi:hypothetical protein TNCV_4320151 [Trichonephila clavipes]|nr:hypothetical protein TNCV_4320151 [Trichonephila clavipes]
MASQFGEKSLRNSCLAFIQLNFNFPQRVRSLVGRLYAYYARVPSGMVFLRKFTYLPDSDNKDESKRQDICAGILQMVHFLIAREMHIADTHFQDGRKDS